MPLVEFTAPPTPAMRPPPGPNGAPASHRARPAALRSALPLGVGALLLPSELVLALAANRALAA